MKENITIEQAEKLLRERVGKIRIEDAAYEWVHETIWDRIEEVEGQYNVVDADGEPCTSDTDREVCWYDDVRDELMRNTFERIAELFAERTGVTKTENTPKVWIVLKNEIWDGENWDLVYGSYRRKEDAQKRLKEERNELYDDWKNEVIDEDSEDGFFAYRNGFYSEFHINLYIQKTELR